MNHPSVPRADSARLTVSFRRERSGDEPFLLKLYASVRQEELDSFGWDPVMRAAFLEMQFKAMRTGYANAFPDAEFLIIVRDEQPIGRAVINRAGEEISIVDVALLPEFRNQGIGTSLITRWRYEAREAKKPLRLSVLKLSPAARLYARLGFVRIGEDGLHDRMECRM